MKKALLCLLIISVSLNLFAGWTRIYGGIEDDFGSSVQQTIDEGYIIAGTTSSYGAGSSDVYLIKTASNGDTLWTRTYGGTSYDYGYSVQQTTDGGYIITGSTSSYGAGYSDIYLIKTASNGDTLWTKTCGGISYDNGSSVQQTTDGGYIITGSTSSYGAGYSDVYLIKTASNGDTLWTKTCGGISYDNGSSVRQTTDGGYIISGYTDSYGAGSADVYLIKTNSNGDTLWTRTYGGTFYDYGSSVQQTTDGGYIITGYTDSYGAVSDDVYLIKTNSNGDTLWTRTYDGGGTLDCGYSIQQTTDGGYIITGCSKTIGSDTCSYVYLIKTDENGVAVEETITSIPNNFSYCINQISNKNVFFQFSLPINDRVELNIYDAAGRYIFTPIAGNYSAGLHTVNFKTENNGVYFFNLLTNRIYEKGKFIVF